MTAEQDSVPDLIIDTTGLNCPLPYLKLRKAIRTVAAGTKILVLSSDPLAPGDFRDLCEALGHQIIDSTRVDDQARTTIRVGPRQDPMITG